MKLIDKSALAAEIERRKLQFMSQADNFHSLGMEEKRDHFAVLASNMYSLLCFIDTLEVKEVNLEKELKVQNKNIWHPMSEPPNHPCRVLMHGYGDDVWIADAVETLEQGAAQEWAYMDDVLTTLRLKAKGE